MKLEELLGEELYKQVQAKIDAANEGESDKLKHIRYADLSEGGYVAKSKYDALDAESKTNASKLAEANGLIEQLQNSAKDDAAIQTQIADYQAKVQQLEAELERTKIDAAVKVGLLSENVEDVDYLTFKLKANGEKLELDENGGIRGWKDKISALKVQLPNMFGGSAAVGERKVLENPLPKGSEEQTVTREQFAAMGYAQRLKLKQENPQQYDILTKG